MNKTTIKQIERKCRKSYIPNGVELKGKLKVYCHSSATPFLLPQTAEYVVAPHEAVAWMKKNRVSLIEERSLLAKRFAKQIYKLNIKIAEEIYFWINGKMYFLDFFFEDYGIGIEIDGQQHSIKNEKIRDSERDAIFRYIGIPTIRMSESDVEDEKMLLNFVEKVNKARESLCKGQEVIDAISTLTTERDTLAASIAQMKKDVAAMKKELAEKETLINKQSTRLNTVSKKITKLSSGSTIKL